MKKYINQLIKKGMLEKVGGLIVCNRKIEKIRESIRNESYKPEPVKSIKIKGRIVWEATWGDKMVEKGVLLIIRENLGVDYFIDIVKAYIKGRGPKDAFKSIKEGFTNVKYLIKTDIRDHFGSIILKELEKDLIKILGKGPFIDLIWKILRGRDGPIKRKKGILQGGVLSPLFSNIYMKEIDEQLEKLDGIKVIRYGDDFLIGTKEDAENTLKIIKKILKKKGLELNKKKTSIVKSEKGLEYLGLNLSIKSEKVIVKGNAKKIIKRLIEKGYVTKEGKGKGKEEFISMSEEEISNIYGQLLKEHLNYYTDCINYVQLRLQIKKLLDESKRKSLALNGIYHP